MAEDPNETARRAFGDTPAMPPPMPPAPDGPPPGQAAAARASSAQDAGAFAAWSTRAAAFALDTLFLFGMMFLVTVVVAVAVGSDDRRTVETIAYAVCIPLYLLYAPLLLARPGRANGQTFGKQMMDIRVVRVDGAPVGVWNGVLRQVIAQQLLTTLVLFYALADYLWPLRDARNQALHDKIARTLVMRTKPAGLPQSPAAAAPPTAGPTPPSPRRVDESPVRDWLPPSAAD
jgi:uncharacterized RDD family membrane protein YckC